MIQRGRHSASLNELRITGTLIDPKGHTHQVPTWIVGDIETWAVGQGVVAL